MPATATPNLITRIKEGDRAAQIEWLSNHLQDLTRWTELCVGVSPGHGGGASDVVQTVGLNLVQDQLKELPARVQTEEQLLAEVRTRLRRRAIDLARKKVLFSISSGPGGSSSGGGLGLADPFVAGYTTPSLQVIRKEREDYILAESGDDENDSPDGLDTGTVIVLLRQIDEVPLKVIAGCLGVGCVETARQYYTALHPFRAGLDHLTIGNWPPEQDTDREKLFRALLKLTDEQREVVELCHLETDAYEVFNCDIGKYKKLKCKYSAREAAEVLGMTSVAVGTCAFRARKRLSEILNRPRHPNGSIRG
jgi:hypothetical protein